MARVLRVQDVKAVPPTGEAAARHLDVRIAELAARQHGVVSRQQLMALGASRNEIQHRVEVRRLRRVHTGVYAIGHRLSVEGHFIAAVLACGDRAAASHRAAGAMWDLIPAVAGPVDVTVPRGGSPRRAGIAIHVTRSLPPAEITRRNGVPCTTWARTLVDLAAVLTPRRLERALEQSQILRHFDLIALKGALAGADGRRGTGNLRRLLGELDDEPPFTRSELERRFLDLVREAGLPRPTLNAVVAGHEVDFHWPKRRVVIETDGRGTHDTQIAFERDHGRDLDLELAGWHVIRISWRQLLEQADRVAAALRARLDPA